MKNEWTMAGKGTRPLKRSSVKRGPAVLLALTVLLASSVCTAFAADSCSRGIFYPHSGILRSEVASIVSRIVDRAVRKPAEPARTEGQVTVSDVDGLFAAVSSGATILLKPGVYNVSDWIEKQLPDWDKNKDRYPNLTIAKVFDGYEVQIHHVSSLTILAEDPAARTELIIEPRYADVLSFSSCSGITLRGFTAGHSRVEGQKGTCVGDVLQFADSRGIALDQLDLYGCGAYGLVAEASSDLLMTDSVIHDCSYGIMNLYDCSRFRFAGSKFRNCREFDMISLYASSAEFEECTLEGNAAGEWCSYVSCDPGYTAAFKSCRYKPDDLKQIMECEGFGSRILLSGSEVIE